MKMKTTRRQKKKPKKDLRFEPITGSTNSLQQALAELQSSETPLYKGMQLLKNAQKDVESILNNANFYHHAARALGTIAMRPCHFVELIEGKVCSDHSEDKSEWCEPCYALHVISGGTP